MAGTAASAVIAALCPVPCAAQARKVSESTQNAGSVSHSRDPLTIKCAGKQLQGCRAASRVPANSPLPVFTPKPEPEPTETLAAALDAAYHTAPALQAQRYALRASDEDYAQALSETRPTTSLQITGDFVRTIDGRLTQSQRFATSDLVTTKALTATASINQPLYTGGKAAADREAALAEIGAGRAQLRGVEGDLLLQVITAYTDIRRDAEALRLRSANLRQLAATLDEVRARREAGELTRTDIGLAETQLETARGQYNSTEQQLEQDRTTFAMLVGHDPGVLAPAPNLPHVPADIEAALDLAQDLSPDLAQAIATEKETRARIGAAAAQGRPTVNLTGSATLTGQTYPYYLHNQDQSYEGRAVLTIPLTNGGRIGALVAQAEDRNAADRLGIETARRQMVATIVNAWNALSIAQRNITVGERQVSAAQTYDEGTFEEYRAGLRSTFDVLYAHTTLRDAEIALVAARHDRYVAEATLLRRIGLLEARSLLTGSGLYNPDTNFRHAAARANSPWDSALRGKSTLNHLKPAKHGLIQPPVGDGMPAMAAPNSTGTSSPQADPRLATTPPARPLPGTTGTPAPNRNLTHP
ncbi:TolC family protein [Novosphingobium sp. SG707]|uniref:TolC family protein n=1 Tax=Novosphingobium sp. SG707 TaxID=2586996 RepID=UPI001444F1A0|nr:TolC family protein [Novosphingobium sp. SG707]